MSHERGQLFLQALPDIDNDLPYSPILVQQLFIQTGEGSMTSLEDIAHTVEQDQGLSAKLLSMANSAFYGLQSQVTTVARAAAVLGLSEIRTIVLSLGVKGLTAKHPCPKEFDLESYWRHQLTVALAARAVAPNFENVNPDALFTAGLLHDLGKLIEAMHRPEDWRAIEAMVASRKVSYRQAEELHWGLDHGLIGALVLKSWDFPPELSEPVSWHHAPDAAPEFKNESMALALADGLAHMMEDAGSAEARRLPRYADLTGLKADALLARADGMIDREALNHFVSQMV